MHFVNAKSILSPTNGMNLYRGCTHGCIYCDSRSICYHIEHDFEDIEVKQNAPHLLENALRRKRKRCMIGTGSMCDPYMHCEETLQLTRQCLQIIHRNGFGLAIQTKSNRILRDMDLLTAIHHRAKCVIQMTLTTYDEDLCRILEPNVCTTHARYQALKQFQQAGIPTVVWLSPILPFINDTPENLRGILDYCIDAGVQGIINFGFGVTLREGDREYFYRALDCHFPGLKEKYIHRYGLSYECTSNRNAELMRIFTTTCQKHGILYRTDDVFAYLHEFPDRNEGEQLRMF